VLVHIGKWHSSLNLEEIAEKRKVSGIKLYISEVDEIRGGLRGMSGIWGSKKVVLVLRLSQGATIPRSEVGPLGKVSSLHIQSPSRTRLVSLVSKQHPRGALARSAQAGDFACRLSASTIPSCGVGDQKGNNAIPWSRRRSQHLIRRPSMFSLSHASTSSFSSVRQ
jgi:hypothetical protein